MAWGKVSVVRPFLRCNSRLALWAIRDRELVARTLGINAGESAPGSGHDQYT